MRLPHAPRHPRHHERATEKELLRRCREGDGEAFGELFVRHRAQARRVAASTSSRLDPDDVSSEAFARIWSALRAGSGPEHAFGPYLRATIQNLAATLGTRARESATEDDRLERLVLDEAQVGDDGFSSSLADHAVLIEAFNSLPQRWRRVLWLVDVEGRGTPDVAGLLGLSPNATAALTLRARDALSEAWLQQHLERRGTASDCQWVQKRMSGFVRHTLSSLQRTRVEQHLEGCCDCSRVRSSMAHLAMSLRAAALVAGGSVLGGAWSLSSVPRAAATTRPTTDAVGEARRVAKRSAGRRLARPSRPFALAGAAATAVAMAGLALGATHNTQRVAAPGAAALIQAPETTPTPTPSMRITAARSPGDAEVRTGSARPAFEISAEPVTFPRPGPTVRVEPSRIPEHAEPMTSRPAEPAPAPPTPSPTASPTDTPTPTPSSTETPTPTPTVAPARAPSTPSQVPPPCHWYDPFHPWC